MNDGDPSQSLALVAAAACLIAASGIPGLFLGWRSAWGPRIAAATTVAGCLLGLAGSCLGLASPASFSGSDSRLALDALSALFTLPVFLVGGLGAVYGASYWTPARHPRHGRRLRFCYGILLASLVFMLIAREGIAFLVAWEGMALSTFFLVTTREEDAAVRASGWLYLLYSHAALLCMVALFLVERRVTGELALAVVPATASPGLRSAFALLALAGFGIKAGMMPLHSWLPAAHAAAPSHVSALMSGVAIKVGVYGLVRTASLVEAPPASWGIALLVLGSASAFFGVLFALAQHDLKRLLAYHSIENVGIMVLGLGLAMAGRSLGRTDWVLLGISGCLLHVWNHALFKSLLFFGAGSVAYATGTRDLERAGGLAKRMPVTAAFFLVGSIAICGLPPLNGFVSELLLYLGMVRAAAIGPSWAALPAPVLAATGALALACFAKAYGIVFLGTPRTAAAGEARESPPLMLAPMAVLAAACVLLGLAPRVAVPALEHAAEAWLRGPLAGESLANVAPLDALTLAGVALLVATALAWAPMARLYRRARKRQPDLPTWDCGFAVSSPRLQYTASSFAQIITSHFGWALHPRVERPLVEGPFPAASRFHTQVEDSVLDRLLEPAGRLVRRFGASVRALPGGQLQRYILYIVAVVVPLLIWALALGGDGP